LFKNLKSNKEKNKKKEEEKNLLSDGSEDSYSSEEF